MKKQMIAALCTLCLAACTVQNDVNAAPVSSEMAEADEVQERMKKMDLKARIEQMTMISIRTFDGQPFTSLNEETENFFETRHPGGFILFSENLSDTDQTVSLIDSLQKETASSGGIRMLIGTDQEGGYITRIPNGTGMSGNMALAATGNSQNAYTAGNIIGSELSSLGINTDFAPDMDVNSNPDNPVIGVRSFSDDPEIVSEYGTAFMKGMRETGVIPCVKHFPGHGDTSTDTHTGLAEVDLTEEELEKRELVPFQEAVNEESDLIMSAHITFPEIEMETCISKLDGSRIHLPATLSHKMITDLLRKKMQYQGVVITDAMNMQAVSDHFDAIDAAQLAINAGVDILLMPIVIEDASGFQAYDAYISSIMKRVQKGEIDEERINESVTRILKLKEKHGILKEDDMTLDEKIQKAEKTVGSAQNRKEERRIAQEGVTVLENKNNLLPYEIEGKTVFGAVDSSQVSLLKEGYERQSDRKEAVYLSYDFGKRKQDVMEALPGSSLVILTTWFANRKQLDPSASMMISSVNEIIEKAHEQGIPVVVISTNLPYDVSAYPEADAVLCVYNPAGKAKTDATGEAVQNGSENLPAAVDVIFHTAPACGHLPVTIPGISGKKWAGTAYERGQGITWN